MRAWPLWIAKIQSASSNFRLISLEAACFLRFESILTKMLALQAKAVKNAP
jgi:hypothetical protein